MSRRFATAEAPHLPSPQRLRRLMGEVMLALLPGMAVLSWWLGPAVWLQAAWCAVVAWGCEWLLLRLRPGSDRGAAGDLSAPLAGLLIGLSLPPLAPWWIGLIASATSIGIGKQLYGGLGHNLFNPAMVGYAAVLLSFPREFTLWHASGSVETVAEAVRWWLAAAPGFDAIAQATPLDAARSRALQGLAPNATAAAHSGWLALAWALGGGYLLLRRIVPWSVPIAVLASSALLSLIAPPLAAAPERLIIDYLCGGGLMLAAFFIATDPVTGCTTPRGRWIFGAGVALFTWLIRRYGSYPDGIAFAILLMNAAAPWIDLHTRPRYYGERA